MNKRYLYILCCLYLTLPLYGRQEKDLFDDDFITGIDRTISLNESKNYLEAYREILSVERSMNSILKDNGVSAVELDGYGFMGIYWPVLKSKAEIAYILGNHSVMKDVQEQMSASLNGWRLKDATEKESKAIINGMYADLAKIYGSRDYLIGQFDSARISLLKALSLKRENSFVCSVYGDLAQLYYRQQQYDMALHWIDSVLTNPLYSDNSRNSESENKINDVRSQRALCLARLGFYADALSEIEPILVFYKRNNEKRYYAEALRKKAKILMLLYDATGQYDSSAESCYQEYLTISKNFIDRYFIGMSESEREEYWMAEQPFVTDCYRLEDKAPELLYDVALYSKAVLLQMGRVFKDNMTESERKDALASIRVSWKDVKSKLPQSACAIEYITYDKSEDSYLGALVISKDNKVPEFIEISKVSDITDFILDGGFKVKDEFADTQDRDKIDALYSSKDLEDIIWNTQIQNAIGDCNAVYFAPDGIFHQLGIEYLVPPCFESKRLYRLTSTRLLTEKQKVLDSGNMLMCGGIEYSVSGQDNEKDNDELAYSLLSPMHLRMDPLPNSQIEIDSISVIRGSHRDDYVLRADSVTEKALKELLGKYHIFHISTHGLFAGASKNGTDIRPSATDVQLSQSCLFLSGAEKNLNKNDFDPSCHDGVLSARELASLDMNNVDLAVMTACMSGLGYITPDGVYGLQRGLKTAGVKSLIASLWNVDDEATCYFVIQLYKNLESGKTLHDSFQSARNSLKKKRRACI